MGKRKADPFNFDDYRQQVPMFFYKRLVIDNQFEGPNNYPYDIIFTQLLDQGYSYLLRRISVKWPWFASSKMIPDLKISFFNKVRGSTYQSVPYPVEHVSSPGKEDVLVVAAPSPVDLTAFGVSMTTLSLKNRMVYNLYYKWKDVIFTKFNFDSIGGEWGKFYIDVMMDGYLIPQKDLHMWD